MHSKPYNPHGVGCKGHMMSFLDCTYDKEEERELLIKCLDNYAEEAA